MYSSDVEWHLLRLSTDRETSSEVYRTLLLAPHAIGAHALPQRSGERMRFWILRVTCPSRLAVLEPEPASHAAVPHGLGEPLTGEIVRASLVGGGAPTR